MPKGRETGAMRGSRIKIDLSQLNRLGTFIAAGTLIGTIAGSVVYIVIGGAIGALFPGIGTIVGTIIGGIVGIVDFMRSDNHTEPKQL